MAQEDETRVIPPRRRNNPDPVQLGLAFLVGLSFTVIVAVGVVYFADLEIVDSSDLVSVPNVLGRSTFDAEVKLRSDGLKPENDYDDMPRRNIVSFFETTVKMQSPVPGTEVEPDSTVELHVE